MFTLCKSLTTGVVNGTRSAVVGRTDKHVGHASRSLARVQAAVVAEHVVDCFSRSVLLELGEYIFKLGYFEKNLNKYIFEIIKKQLRSVPISSI